MEENPYQAPIEQGAPRKPTFLDQFEDAIVKVGPIGGGVIGCFIAVAILAGKVPLLVSLAIGWMVGFIAFQRIAKAVFARINRSRLSAFHTPDLSSAALSPSQLRWLAHFDSLGSNLVLQTSSRR